MSSIDADIIFVKLTGSRQMKEVLVDNLPYDRKVKSPNLGYFNHLLKNNVHVPNNSSLGKLEFEGFLKAIEMIAIKIYPEYDLDQSIKYILENYILTVEQFIINLPSEERVVGGQPLKTLVEILRNPEMVNNL